ncbi:MAG: hypothetical protein HY699_14695 [Deltaproteobacteria bacterium]|nr:hypothetical protein [Deltaproteobacteria bacterium]
MNSIFGLPLTALAAYAGDALPAPLSLPLLWATVLVWAMIALLLAAVAGIVGAGERPLFAGRSAARPRLGPLACAPCCGYAGG